jgi:hypothetical protein
MGGELTVGNRSQNHFRMAESASSLFTICPRVRRSERFLHGVNDRFREIQPKVVDGIELKVAAYLGCNGFA